jgi:dTDP-glucose 4,6-dehydratase
MVTKNHSILLTGASGFAGSHMLRCLLKNTTSHIFCPVTYRHGGSEKRIKSIVSSEFTENYTVFECDLAQENLNDFNFLSDVSLIINFASESHVDRSITEPRNFMSNNINLMINLLEFARLKSRDLQFIHVSTDEVYGALDKSFNNTEWTRPHLPSNPYSASKSAQESLVVSYYKTFDLNISIINSTNILGEGQNQEKYIPKVIRKILNNEDISVDTDIYGTMGSRKYVYAGDVADAVNLISKLQNNSHKFTSKKNLPERFHISGIDELSNLEIVKIISKILNMESKININPSPRPGYDLRYELSSNKLRDLGWVESKPIIQRLKEIVEWTVSRPEWLNIDYDPKI